MLGKLLDDIVSNPVETALDMVTQPVTDAYNVLEGLSEGELRERAAIRLGTDVVASMALSEVIEALSDAN